jgi:hypothetical protein
MNVLKKVQFNLGEASTKRGIALFIAGSVALYHLLLGAGDAPNLDAVTARAEFWLSIGAQLSGLIGMFVADEPKTIHVNLPPLDLQGRSDSGPGLPRAIGVRVDVPPGHYAAPGLDERGSPPGFNDQ